MRIRPALRLAGGLLLAAAVGYFVAFKTGRLAAHPPLLAGMVSVLAVALMAVLAGATADLVRGRGRGRALGEAATAAGRLTVALAGLANWAFGLQGAVMLFERRPVRLDRIEQLAAFEAGPVAALGELVVRWRWCASSWLPPDPGAFARPAT